MTIELSEEQTQALNVTAMARGISVEHYARQVLEQDLAPEWLQKSWEKLQSERLGSAFNG